MNDLNSLSIKTALFVYNHIDKTDNPSEKEAALFAVLLGAILHVNERCSCQGKIERLTHLKAMVIGAIDAVIAKQEADEPYKGVLVMTDGTNYVQFIEAGAAIRYGDNDPDDILRAVSKHCCGLWIDEYTETSLREASFNYDESNEDEEDEEEAIETELQVDEARQSLFDCDHEDGR